MAIPSTEPTVVTAGASVTVDRSLAGVDTSVDKALTFTGYLATATDYIVLEGFTVEVLPTE